MKAELQSAQGRVLTHGLRLVAGLTVALGIGCRGQKFDQPPIHLNPNMDQQWRVDMQEPNPHYTDERGMRMPPAGTVVAGSLEATDAAHTHLHEGLLDGRYTDTLPAGMTLDATFMARGKERFGIYCTPCHNETGRGDGVVVQRGYAPPQSFMEPRLRAFPLGRIVNVLKHGKANMPSYADQVPVQDRWAIASYVRVLQVAQSTPQDLFAAAGGK